jgi:hypothetical protein
MSADNAERQPLLASREQSVQHPQFTDNISVPVIDLEGADTSTPGAVKRTTYLWPVLWCIIIISGGITALIFIKDFIDAGDVDVSPL